MSTLKQVIGSRTSLSSTALSTLANATYLSLANVVPNTNQPVDVLVEVMVGTTNTPSGNKQVVVYVQDSLDGTNFRSGPTSGTTTTDEPDLAVLGAVPLNTSAGTRTHRGIFSVANALGYVPHTFTPVFKNDCGVALTTATVFVAEVSMTIT